MTVGDINNLCTQIPGMKEKCRKEMVLVNLSTRAELSFWLYIEDEDGGYFDPGDPVDISIIIKWGEPGELIAKLESIHYFVQNEFTHDFLGNGWHGYESEVIWDSQQSLKEFIEDINNYTLEELTNGTMNWMIEKYIKYEDLEIPDEIDPSEDDLPSGWQEQYIPESAFEELEPYASHITWDIDSKWKTKDLYFDFDKIISAEYQKNRDAREEVIKQLKNWPGITSDTLDMIFKFAGINEKGVLVGPIRDDFQYGGLHKCSKNCEQLRNVFFN
jgi:hypothetical protein